MLRLGVLVSLVLHAFGRLDATVRPLVIWHGLGDSHSSPGMLQFMDMIRDVHPGIFIHSVHIEEDLEKDRRASFQGHVDEQVDFAAAQFTEIPELQDGFDAMGFSQGGQFLRAYIERYNSPPVHNLITFGSQHMGVSDLPLCRRYDFFCQIARRAAKGAVYSDWAQNNFVPAQYFRDPNHLDEYLASNVFLTSINNELSERNETYKENLASLKNFVLIMFTEDTTSIPKESAWFGSEAPPEEMQFLPDDDQRVIGSPSSENAIIPMRMHPIYTEDWIGLRLLDTEGRLVFETCEGEHMHIDRCWEPVVRRYCGGLS